MVRCGPVVASGGEQGRGARLGRGARVQRRLNLILLLTLAAGLLATSFTVYRTELGRWEQAYLSRARLLMDMADRTREFMSDELGGALPARLGAGARTGRDPTRSRRCVRHRGVDRCRCGPTHGRTDRRLHLG